MLAQAEPTPLFKLRSLVVGLEIYADNENTELVLIGNNQVQTSATSVDGFPGNNYFQLDPGRHAYIWTDKPETETFDVAMFWAAQINAGVPQYLHCTHWQPQAIAQ